LMHQVLGVARDVSGLSRLPYSLISLTNEVDENG